MEATILQSLFPWPQILSLSCVPLPIFENNTDHNSEPHDAPTLTVSLRQCVAPFHFLLNGEGALFGIVGFMSIRK